MEEMPSSWWNRSGYRSCILIVFLFFAIIATVCCSFSFYFAREQKDQLLDLPGNWSRIQRATGVKLGSNARADEFSANGGSVTDAVSVNESSALTVRLNGTETSKSVSIDPRMPPVPSYPIPAAQNNNGNSNIQKIPKSDQNTNDFFNKTSPRITARRKYGPRSEEGPVTDPRSRFNPVFDRQKTEAKSSAADPRSQNTPFSDPADVKTNQKTENRNFNTPGSKNDPDPAVVLSQHDRRGGISKNFEFYQPNDTASVQTDSRYKDHGFRLRSVETGSNADSASGEGNAGESSSDIAADSASGKDNAGESSPDTAAEAAAPSDPSEVNAASNEAIQDTDPNFLNEMNSVTDDEVNAGTEMGVTDSDADVNAVSVSGSTNPDINAVTRSGMTDGDAAAESVSERIAGASGEADAVSGASAANADANAAPEANSDAANSAADADGNAAPEANSDAANSAAAADVNAAPEAISDAANSAEMGVVEIMQRVKRSMSGRENGVSNKLNLHNVARLGSIVKKSFVGYPSFYGLWYKNNPFRERVHNKESLHKSDEFQDIPLSLIMDDVLNRMAFVDSAKIDNSGANQPLYGKKFHLRVANPIPQDASEMDSSSSTPAAEADLENPSAAAENDEMPAYESNPMEGYESNPMEGDQQSTSVSPEVATSAPEYEEVDGQRQMLTVTGTPKSTTVSPATTPAITTTTSAAINTTTTSAAINTTTTPITTMLNTTTAPCKNKTEDECLCDFNCDHISMDFSDFGDFSSCEDACRLRSEACFKNKASDESPNKGADVLKKNDARVKRNAALKQRLRKLRPEHKSAVSNFHLSSVIAPKRKIARYNF